jgi:hypothetical protein
MKSSFLKIYRFFSFFLGKPMFCCWILKYGVSDIRIAGTNFTLIGNEWIIKIVNPHRITSIENESKFKKIFVLKTKKEELEKFLLFNKNAEGYLKDGVLFLKRFDALTLKEQIDNQEMFLFSLELSIKKLQEVIKLYGNAHGDFHIDNILIKNEEVYFIDFDYDFISKEALFESDMLNLIYVLQKEHSKYFKRDRNLLVELFQRYCNEEKLIQAKKLLSPLIENSLDRFVDDVKS